MQLLDSIRLGNGRQIDLCQGDLTDLARNEWFDAIVVSAFNDNYDPTPGSVVGALHRKGVSVGDLAKRKDLDYTESHATWLSDSVQSSDPSIGFGRILCFEPGRLGEPPQVVRYLFRAVLAITEDRPGIRSIALPILSAGDMGHDITEMLPPILEAAYNSMVQGLPLDRIVVVVRSDSTAKAAAEMFAAQRDRKSQYDVFVSYSSKNTRAREDFVSALLKKRPDTRVFVDRLEIDDGAAWQQAIFDSLDRCRRIVALITPDYLSSEICKEEFHIGMLRSRDERQKLLRPVFLAGEKLPTYIRSRQYADCRQFDIQKLTAVAERLAADLG
jgi:hypothetical protein